MAEGRYGEAASSFEEAKEAFDSAGDRLRAVYSAAGVAGAFYKMGRRDEALRRYEWALKELEELDADLKFKAKILGNLGMAFLDLGRPKEALPRIEEARRLFGTLGFKREESLVLLDLAQAQAVLGMPDNARNYMKESLSAAREAGDPEAETRALLMLAEDAYRKNKNVDESARLLEEAQAAAEKSKDARLVGLVLRSRGSLHYQAGDLGAALSGFGEAWSFAKRVGDDAGAAESLVLIAAVHRARSDVDEARAAYGKAEEALGDGAGGRHDPMIFSIRLARAGLEEQLKEKEKAATHYRRALAVCRKLKTPADCEAISTRLVQLAESGGKKEKGSPEEKKNGKGAPAP